VAAVRLAVEALHTDAVEVRVSDVLTVRSMAVSAWTRWEIGGGEGGGGG